MAGETVYIVYKARTLAELETLCSAALVAGYTLQGGIAVVNKSEATWFYQAAIYSA